MEEEYEIEPFMPGISPLGKATPATKQFSVARPYIPYGTGYNAFRLRPGYSKVKEQISGVGRTEYTPQKFKGEPLKSTYNVVRPPQDYLDLNKNSSPFGKFTTEVLAKEFNSNLNKNFDLNHKNKIGVQQYVPDRKAWGTIKGLYSADTHSVIYPKDDPGNTKRHELQHAIQQRRMNGKKAQNFKGPTLGINDRRFVPGETMSTNAKELEANIVQNKSIRKGYERFAEGQKFYDIPENRKYGNRVKSKILNMIPGEPGKFTGRLPTMRGVGGNLIDMFSLPSVPPSMPMPHETHGIFGQPLDQGAGFEPEMIPSPGEYDYEVEPLEYPDQGGTLPRTYGPKMIPNPRAGQAIDPYGVI